MRLRPAFLLCGVVLLTAVPVLADRIPYPMPDQVTIGSAQEWNSSTGLADSSMSNITESWARQFPDAAYKFLPTSLDANPVSLSDLSSIGVATSKSSITEALWASHEGGEHGLLDSFRHHDRDPHSHAELVPEPGSLPLVLMGLFAIGLVSLRRKRVA
jgi:PEP-CTERM motif